MGFPWIWSNINNQDVHPHACHSVIGHCLLQSMMLKLRGLHVSFGSDHWTTYDVHTALWYSCQGSKDRSNDEVDLSWRQAYAKGSQKFAISHNFATQVKLWTETPAIEAVGLNLQVSSTKSEWKMNVYEVVTKFGSRLCKVTWSIGFAGYLATLWELHRTAIILCGST